MISLWLQETEPGFFGVASHEDSLVATVLSRTRADAERALRGCLPADAACEIAEAGSVYQRSVVAMLARLERGDEADKCFRLSPLHVSESLAAVLRTAAAIPLGYVATYGHIADSARTEARVVGQVMATNPLYPIVPCHRVVGADLSLVGYGGSRQPAALRAKLQRLRAESRGYDRERRIDGAGDLMVSPVEWVIIKAVRDGVAEGPQMELW